MNKDSPATSDRAFLRVQGVPSELPDIDRPSEFIAQPIVTNNCRDFPIPESTPIKIDYDLESREDYATLDVRNVGEIPNSRREGDTVTFTWIPGNYSGNHELTVKTFNRKGERVRSIRFIVRIAPWKIHEDDFFRMHNDLRERQIRIYDILSPASIEEKKDFQRFSNLYEQAKFVEERIREIETVVYLISKNPRKRVIHELELQLLHQSFRPDATALLSIVRNPQYLVPCNAARNKPSSPLQSALLHKRTRTSYLPEKILSSRSEISYNVSENRLLKRFLVMLVEILVRFRKMIELEYQRITRSDSLNQRTIDTLQKIMRDAKDQKTRISSILHYTFLRDVAPALWLTETTPTLECDVNYRRFHELYQEFLWSPLFQKSEIFKLELRDLPTVYEYWCAFFLCESILDLRNQRWKVANQSLVTRSKRIARTFDLRRKGPLLSLTQKSKRIDVYFQRSFRPGSHREYYSYTNSQKPDLVVVATKNNSRKIAIFDPKYRYNLEVANDPESAINKMHVYKDSIRATDGSRPAQHAYVFYPGRVGKPLADGDKEFKVADEIIGAIALRPADDGELQQRKEKLIDIIKSLL